MASNDKKQEQRKVSVATDQAEQQDAAKQSQGLPQTEDQSRQAKQAEDKKEPEQPNGGTYPSMGGMKAPSDPEMAPKTPPDGPKTFAPKE